ncbi:V-type proton ATPase 116 kDa subunit a isoform 4 [Blattella germanica]|nr:V-type proton ATPase 116 kDa subunit a isoform 4 [Blattella germanica]
MALCTLYLGADTAYECVAALGELGAVEFKTKKKNEKLFHHQFAHKIRMCSEMERRIRYFEMEIMKRGEIGIEPPEDHYSALKPSSMNDLDTMLQMMENELMSVLKKYDLLKKTNLDLAQMEQVLNKTDMLFDGGDVLVKDKKSEDRLRGLLSTDQFPSREELGMKLGNVAGVISQKNVAGFRLMLHRVGHGNLVVHMRACDKPFEEPDCPNPVFKSMFLIYFQGDELKGRVTKICNGFKATLYNCPENLEEREALQNTLTSRMKDIAVEQDSEILHEQGCLEKAKALDETELLRMKLLRSCAKNLKMWQIKVAKMKSVFYVLNCLNMDTSSIYMITDCWIPVSHFDMVRLTLERAHERARGSVPPILMKVPIYEEPPTYNTTNKYSAVIQQLVDSYGYGKYGEINPDLGHGLIIFLAGLTFILTERRIKWEKTGEIMNIFFDGRYLILLLGIFSMYTGILYNECFSVSINIFGSAWKVNFTEEEVMNNKDIELNPEEHFSKVPYPFGMDPVWMMSENNLTVMNSLKMKLSIVFGVIHMMFGIFLGLWNFLFFKHTEKIIGEFLPHLLFLSCIFFYMVVLIIFKWLAYGPLGPGDNPSSGIECAPSILTTMILMVMVQKPREVPGSVCKPEMYAWQKRRKPQKSEIMSMASRDASLISAMSSESNRFQISEDFMYGEEEDMSVSEQFIYQGIHTIEFVLGCVSHTASYLRLWALSLAHARKCLLRPFVS